MTCRELAELLCDYVGGELSAEQCEQIRLHIAQCHPCLHYIESYRLTIQITRRLPLADMPAETAARLQAALRAAQTREV